MVLAEAKVEKLRAATASAEEAVERAKTETAAQAATREKATLEARVSELEHDLGTATTDLATTGRQFSQVTNQLQVVTKEAV
jgi:predicted  nucleic acid-binding Zn-ribbon protein